MKIIFPKSLMRSLPSAHVIFCPRGLFGDGQRPPKSYLSTQRTGAAFQVSRKVGITGLVILLFFLVNVQHDPRISIVQFLRPVVFEE